MMPTIFPTGILILGAIISSQDASNKRHWCIKEKAKNLLTTYSPWFGSHQMPGLAFGQGGFGFSQRNHCFVRRQKLS